MMNTCALKIGSAFWMLLIFLEVPCQLVPLGGWDDNGVPDYLEEEHLSCSLEFWENLNQTLPERQSVTINSAEYLNQSLSDLYFQDSTAVEVVFIHEGAGWKNSLFYYTYQELPQEIEDLEKYIVFPNVSYWKGGGAMVHGMRVNLGTFPPGTHLGFGLLARGWNRQTQTVGPGIYPLFTEESWNPEGDPALKKHAIWLADPEREMLVLGFEDIRRDWQSCDEDFNDCIFGVITDDYDGLNTETLPELSTAETSCYSVPEQLGVEEIKLYKATLMWEEIPGAETYRVRYRKWSSDDPWQYRNAGTDTVLTIGEVLPLQSSTYYEWQVAVTCDGQQTGNSVKHVFETLSPCDMPLSAVANDVTETTARLTWGAVPGAENYLVRYREADDEDFEWRHAGENNYLDVEDLSPNTTYEWNVQAQCSPLESCFSPYLSHHTFFTAPLPPEPRSADCGDRPLVAEQELIQTWSHSNVQVVYEDDDCLVFHEDQHLNAWFHGQLFADLIEVSDLVDVFAFAMGEVLEIGVLDQHGFRFRSYSVEGDLILDFSSNQRMTTLHHEGAEWHSYGADDGFIYRFHENSWQKQVHLSESVNELRIKNIAEANHPDLLYSEGNKLGLAINNHDADTLKWLQTLWNFESDVVSFEVCEDHLFVLDAEGRMHRQYHQTNESWFWDVLELHTEHAFSAFDVTWSDELGVYLFLVKDEDGFLQLAWWDVESDHIVHLSTTPIAIANAKWQKRDGALGYRILHADGAQLEWWELTLDWELPEYQLYADRDEGTWTVVSDLEGIMCETSHLKSSHESLKMDDSVQLTWSDERCANHWAKRVEIPAFEEEISTPVMYPNPVQDELFIRWDLGLQETDLRFTIYSQDGKMIQSGASILREDQCLLDLGFLTKGVYIIEVKTANQRHSSVLIKQ